MAKVNKQNKVQVTARALVQRINYDLAKNNDLQVKKTRGARALLDLGEYYILDVARNFVRETHVDIEDLGRELKVLADYECLEEEGEEL
jgi:hypothetical protein